MLLHYLAKCVCVVSSGRTLGDGVVGKAPIMTICTWQYSGGVNLVSFHTRCHKCFEILFSPAAIMWLLLLWLTAVLNVVTVSHRTSQKFTS